MFSFYEKFVMGLTTVVVCVAFFAALVAIVYVINKVQCYKKYADYSPEYSFWGGCQIEINGKLIPVEAVRTTDL